MFDDYVTLALLNHCSSYKIQQVKYYTVQEYSIPLE
jgi:hypothetical protein